ncbi:MAG: trigger factor, partial [Anaerolineales bacterium]
MLKIDTHTHEDRMMHMTVEVPEDRVQPALQKAARDLSKRYPMPGFRPGKAPYEHVVRQFGERAVYEMAIDELSQKVYQEALDQEKIEAYGAASLNDFELKPMVLKYTVPLKPVVEMGDYRALRVPYDAPIVQEEEFDRVLESLRERQAVLEPVERAAALGDVLTLDINSFLNEGLNPSDFLMTDKDVALQLDENADWPMPGFVPQVVGMAANETRKFDLAFPENYANESLRGQVAHFEVTSKEVKQRALPEWNDDLAKEIGEFQTLDELKVRVREDLQKQAERSTGREYQDKVLNQLVEQTTVQYPPALLEAEVDDLIEDLDNRLREQKLTLEDYLKIEGKTKEQVREEFKPRAEQRLKRALVLGRIVEAEKLEVQPEDVVQQIEQSSAMWGDQAGRIREYLTSDKGRQSLVVDMLTTKAMDRITASAKGEEIPLPEIETSA